MKKLESINNFNLDNLKPYEFQNTAAIKGGDENTGGGNRTLANGQRVCWDSDCTSGGTTMYYGVQWA